MQAAILQALHGEPLHQPPPGAAALDWFCALWRAVHAAHGLCSICLPLMPWMNSTIGASGAAHVALSDPHHQSSPSVPWSLVITNCLV